MDKIEELICKQVDEFYNQHKDFFESFNEFLPKFEKFQKDYENFLESHKTYETFTMSNSKLKYVNKNEKILNNTSEENLKLIQEYINNLNESTKNSLITIGNALKSVSKSIEK